jgi:hypothetical protein
VTPRSSPVRAAILLVVSLLVATLAAALLPAAPASAGRTVGAATPTPSPNPSPATTPGTSAEPRPVDAVTVEITEVTRSGSGPDGELTVAAQLRNTGTGAFSLDSVRLSVTAEALEDRQALTDWTEPRQRPAPPRAPGESAGGGAGAEVPPGATTKVVFTVPADKLPRVRDGARGRQVHGIAVRARGRTEDDPVQRLRGTGRSFVVLASEEGAQARLTVVVPITADGPTPDAGTASEQLRASWAAEGRLSRVLTAAADPALSWLVDPALALAARTVARGEEATPATSSPGPTGRPRRRCVLRRRPGPRPLPDR